MILRAALLSTLLLSSLHAVGLSDLRCEYRSEPLGIDVEKPRLSWRIDVDQRGTRQVAYQILVGSNKELLANDKSDLWDSGKVTGDDSLHIEYAGKPLRSRSQYFWKVRIWDQDGRPSAWSNIASWGMGILRQDEWLGMWIQSDLELFDYQQKYKLVPDHDREPESAMWGRAREISKATAKIDEAPAVWLRKEFATPAKPVVRAKVFISGLGFNEVFLNGKKINDHFLNNAQYDYGKTVPYQVHDVTRFIRQGSNALGVMLGNGYFNPVVPSVLREYAADFINTPRLRCELRMEYTDGSTESVVSDPTWQFTTDGPIRFNSVRAGDTYDARKELGDWSSPGYRADSWRHARPAEAPAGRLASQELPPVRLIQEIPAVSVKKRGDAYRFDIGVESTGWARLKIRGNAGQKITLKYPGANSHTLGRYQECQYICKGDAEETYEPRFSFNGFRFIDVTGLTDEPKPNDLVGCQMVSDLQAVGSFSCSSPELNRIQEVVIRTIRNYYIQTPMDPVREKVCWTQDVQSNFEPTSYNYDVSRIYAKWQDDYINSVQADGYVPTVVPSCFDGPTINCPWWGGMIIYNPWQLYQFCGDRRILEQSYEPMKKYLGYLDSIAKDNVIEWGLGDWLEMHEGKQPPRPIGTTVPYTSTCAYFLYADILRQTAELLGKPREAQAFAAKRDAIRIALDARFYNPSEGFYDRGSQTSFILALKLGLQQGEKRTRLIENLKARIAKDNDHLSCGFVGLPYLLTFLTENNMGDLSWRIATQPTYPGWYDMIFTRNNSVLKEDWAGKLVQMPSLGVSIGGWFYRCLGGIRSEAPGFKSFTIQPYTDTLDWVKSRYQSPHGEIRSDWSKKDGHLTMEVTIPVNTSATVHVPCKDAAGVTESGKPAATAVGVKFLRTENGAAVYAVRSGSYRFESLLPQQNK